MARRRPLRTWPDGFGALAHLRRAVDASGIDPVLLELVRLRASQLNGCEDCVERHTAGAREAGETEGRLGALAGWRSAPVFSSRERAALELTEAVTFVAGHDGVEAAVAGAAEVFAPDELTRLLYAVIEINAWNRLVVASGAPQPGPAARTSGSAEGS